MDEVALPKVRWTRGRLKWKTVAVLSVVFGEDEKKVLIVECSKPLELTSPTAVRLKIFPALCRSIRPELLTNTNIRAGSRAR